MYENNESSRFQELYIVKLRKPIFISMIRLKQLLTEWTGESWKSCIHWTETKANWDGGKTADGRVRPKIDIEKSSSSFRLAYTGPASGWAISHANRGSGDTLHQIFNVLICECNPWLKDQPLQPNIANVAITSRVNKGTYDVTITIPMLAEADDAKHWQIDRRGGMGHDPGASSILDATREKPNRQGPIRYKVDPGNITEYMVCYTLPKKP